VWRARDRRSGRVVAGSPIGPEGKGPDLFVRDGGVGVCGADEVGGHHVGGSVEEDLGWW